MTICNDHNNCIQVSFSLLKCHKCFSCVFLHKKTTLKVLIWVFKSAEMWSTTVNTSSNVKKCTSLSTYDVQSSFRHFYNLVNLRKTMEATPTKYGVHLRLGIIKLNVCISLCCLYFWSYSGFKDLKNRVCMHMGISSGMWQTPACQIRLQQRRISCPHPHTPPTCPLA